MQSGNASRLDCPIYLRLRQPSEVPLRDPAPELGHSLWTWYLQSSSRKFLHMWHKHSQGLREELMRFWCFQVKGQSECDCTKHFQDITINQDVIEIAMWPRAISKLKALQFFYIGKIGHIGHIGHIVCIVLTYSLIISLRHKGACLFGTRNNKTRMNNLMFFKWNENDHSHWTHSTMFFLHLISLKWSSMILDKQDVTRTSVTGGGNNQERRFK